MKNKSTPNLEIGLLIAVLGLGFLMDSLNIFSFGSIISTWWPLLIIGTGITKLLADKRNYTWPIIIIAIGAVLQLRELGLLSFDVWSLIWPSIIIFVGLSMAFKK